MFGNSFDLDELQFAVIQRLAENVIELEASLRDGDAHWNDSERAEIRTQIMHLNASIDELKAAARSVERLNRMMGL